MKKWYNIQESKSKKDKRYYDVFILDEIGGFGVSAREFIKELSQIDADVINLHIDSVGGSILDGIAMYNYLRAKDAQVDVYIGGLAGSIASIIILAGDNVYIPENGSVFTHLPMLGGIDYPNRKDLENGIEELAKFEQVLSNIYQKHTGASPETVMGWLENDTWFFGQEAVDAGLATAVVDKVQMVARLDDVLKTPLFASLPQDVGDKLEQIRNEVKPTMETTENKEVEETEEVEATEETSPTIEAKAEETEVVAQVTEDVAEVEAEEAEEAEQAEEVELEDEAEEESDAEDALAYEYNRKAGIKAIVEKYNANGILNDIAIDALTGDTSVDSFKDIVLEKLAKAPTKQQLNKLTNTKDKGVDEIRAELAETKDPVKKGLLARQLRDIR
tara:strand:- start:850 stop:2016 length:1167 start_codon:yes stop_codon:yes gene_type:complete